ncbi:MAG: ribose-phosphate diphosphokinase [bacterium]
MPYGELKIFAGSASKQLAQEVVDFLDSKLGQMDIIRFSDGEVDVNIKESVRGKNIFIIQSTCPPANENIMELLIVIDAMHRNDARKVYVVTPYYGYSRKERKTKPRDPISGKMVADILTTVGAEQMLFFDLHTTALEGFFNIPTTHLGTTQILANAFIHYKENIGKVKPYLKDIPFKKISEERRFKVGEETVVVAPDVGGARRARDVARYLGRAHFAIIEKRRPTNDSTEVLNIIGDVNGLEAIIIDDMISTGGTMIPLVKILRERGAKKVYGAVTHPVFVGNAVKNLQDAGFDALFVTNTIHLPEEKRWKGLHIVSVGDFLAAMIHRIHEHRSVSELF